ncbi:uncharacterized protein LOC107360953 [Tetranychus urticae]|uniref:uncharacterized protein LOC107360953 n=1 Tax=Tetranychus urticae TaxID=32264 RepID=UPI00077B8C0D|nr:uncharacterized protein LOC107360953 [Tetranychus urticae]
MSVKLENGMITIGIDDFKTVLESVIAGSRVIPVPTFVCSKFNVSDWINDFEAKTEQSYWDDNRRLQKVRCYLHAHVASWYDSIFENPETRPKDWKEFKELMVRCYSPVGHVNYFERFYTTRQEENEFVIDFCSKMFYYAKKANIDFQTFVTTCIERFRREIYIEFLRFRLDDIQTFDKLIERARIAEENSRMNNGNLPICYGDVDRHDLPYRYVTVANANLSLKPCDHSKTDPAADQHRYNGAPDNNNIFASSSYCYNVAKYTPAAVVNANASTNIISASSPSTVKSQIAEMVDMLKEFIQNSVNYNQRARTNVTCYYCQKVGHIANQCYKKQRDQQKRQGNMF